jgi:SWIM/SEC-C metal-binding protein
MGLEHLNKKSTKVKPFSIKKSNGKFTDEKRTKIGSPKNPAKIVVKTEERREEIREIFKSNGWIERTKVRPNEDEDLRDLDTLLMVGKTTIKEHHTGRNEPCHCGSGKKYKKCCLNK